jgi:serine/threonine protein kinase
MGNGSLHGLIHNPSVRLTSSQMIKITVEIALAMNYLHQHDPIILHRDLKSSNVLISESWNVKVSDFGLAELRDAQGLPAHCGYVVLLFYLFFSSFFSLLLLCFFFFLLSPSLC